MPRWIAYVCVACLSAGLAACDAPDAPRSSSSDSSRVLRQDLAEVADAGQASLRADIEIPLGRVEIGAAEPGMLFQAETRLPAALRTELDSETVPGESGDRAEVTFGADGETVASFDDLRTLGDDLSWRLLFGRRAPTDLSLDLGVASADLDLTGVPLTRLAVHAGAGRTRLAFRAANPVPMRELEIQAGVRTVEAVGLGWARFEQMTFEGGVGRFALDFSGDAWVPGAEVELNAGVATVEVTLPRRHPVVVVVADAPGLSVSPPPGFVVAEAAPGESRFTTPGAGDDALTVRVETGPGRVRFRVAE